MVAGRSEVMKGVQEQVRGMKVRSSVKKLCEGCKACPYSPIVLEAETNICGAMIALWIYQTRRGENAAQSDLANEALIGCTEERRQEGEGLCVYHLSAESET